MISTKTTCQITHQMVIVLGLLLAGILIYGCSPNDNSTPKRGDFNPAFIGRYRGTFQSNNKTPTGSLHFELSPKGKVTAQLIKIDTTIAAHGKVFTAFENTHIVFTNADSTLSFGGNLTQQRTSNITANGTFEYCPPCVFEFPACKIACREESGNWHAKEQ